VKALFRRFGKWMDRYDWAIWAAFTVLNVAIGAEAWSAISGALFGWKLSRRLRKDEASVRVEVRDGAFAEEIKAQVKAVLEAAEKLR
jgi:hypothetical protein